MGRLSEPIDGHSHPEAAAGETLSLPLALAAGDGGHKLTMWVDAAPSCSHLGYGEDLILVATSPEGVQNMCGDLEAAFRSKGPRIRPEKLQLWRSFRGSLICVGRRNLHVKPPVVFLGALLCRDRAGAVGYHVGTALTKFWAANGQFTSGPSPDARMQRLRAEILPAMTWGPAAWHLRPHVISVAEKAPVRMTKVVLQLCRPKGDS